MRGEVSLRPLLSFFIQHAQFPCGSSRKGPREHSRSGHDHHSLSSPLYWHVASHSNDQRRLTSNSGQIHRDSSLERGPQDLEIGRDSKFHTRGSTFEFGFGVLSLGCIPVEFLKLYRKWPLLQKGASGTHHGIHVRPVSNARDWPQTNTQPSITTVSFG